MLKLFGKELNFFLPFCLKQIKINQNQIHLNIDLNSCENKNNQIIALVGLCGSGKSSIGHYLQELGYKKVYFGDLTIQELKKNNMPIVQDNERFIREKLRAKYGMGAYALLNLNKINHFLDQKLSVFIDGLYSLTELKILQKNFQKKLKIVAIFTPKTLRYSRLSKRKERALNPIEAEKRDYAEIQNLEKAGPIAIADETIVNDDTLEKAKLQMKNILINI